MTDLEDERRADLMTELRAEILNQGSKGLLLLNGGGAVALGTFLQAMWGKPGAGPLEWGLLVGIGILSLGALLGGSIFFTRYRGSLHPESTRPKYNPWSWAQLALTLGALLSFTAGMLVAVFSGFIALACR